MKLAILRDRDRPDDDQKLRVVAPTHSAQAVPGIYMLFVVDQDGVPSEGRKVVIRPDSRGPAK